MSYHKFISGRKEGQEVNELRARCGMASVEKRQKDRKCLRCDQLFVSIGPENRMCEYCAGKFYETAIGKF